MDNTKVLAKVADREITQEDLNFFLQNLNPQTAAQFQSEEGQKQLLEEIINQELFSLEALDNRLDKSEDYLVSLARLKDSLLKQLAIGKFMEDIQVSEEEMNTFYEENKAQFASPKSVQASHILVDEEEAAKNILEEINSGLSFEEAAQKYSSCPSKERGGDLGFFSQGQMVPEFEEAAFNAEVGATIGPVKSQFGYHIIKVVDEKEEGIKSVEDVAPQIQQQLLAQKQQNAYFAKVEDLKKNYKVEVL